MVPRAISDAVSAALHPDHFFVAPPAMLRLEFADGESISWEVFRGHLLDASRTRQRRVFAAWHVFLDEPPSADSEPVARSADPPGAPRVSFRWDPTEQKLFVTRNILTQAWEAYEPQPGVIDSRPVRRWTPELVATIAVDAQSKTGDGTDGADDRLPMTNLIPQLEATLALAWTGVSRLPITSIEAPLPDFALGRMAYFPAGRDVRSPCDSARHLFTHSLDHPTASNSARQFEVALRAVEPKELRGWLSELEPSGGPTSGQNRSASEASAAVSASSAAASSSSAASTAFATPLVSLVQSVFHHVSLTPYTQFAENLLLTVEHFSQTNALGVGAGLDLFGHMIRHLIRHLTAYDLVRFHSFGANYPDALWLDGLLKHWLTLARSAPHEILSASNDDDSTRAFKRRRRRALRQAWLIRRSYEGHRVPDHPTSRGENVRVIPGLPTAVPDAQITQPGARRKRLYDGDPTDRLFADSASARLLAEALSDLRYPLELRELGMATFLDRPFGIFKATGEVDRTPMLAYEAFSSEIAQRRLEQLFDGARSLGLPGGDAAGVPAESYESSVARLADCVPVGFPAADLPGASRPGIIMLEDARVAAGDFVFLRTVRSSYERLAATPTGLTADQWATFAAWSTESTPSLLIRTGDAAAAIAGQPWITRFERRDARLRPVERIALSPRSHPEYVESLGVEFLAHGIELRPTAASTSSTAP